MDEEQKTNHQLLRRLRPKLIEILSADPEFILQHAYSRQLVTDNGYKKVKAQLTPAEKVTSLLDHIYDRGLESSHGLLNLLKQHPLQETFPKLSILVNRDVDLNLSAEEASKRTAEDSAEQTRSTKQLRMSGPEKVTKVQLMKVAGAMTRNWKKVGILVLDISSEKLDEIEAQSNLQNKMRAIRMLQFWCSRQKENATADKLYSLLSNEELALAPEMLKCIQ